jgi:deoxyribodipyrimidine photo-lyase
MTALVWFRRDLRLHDNPSLMAARAQHEQIVPVFCLDKRLLQGRHRSLPRTRLLLGCLSSLAADLEMTGSRLVVLSDSPTQAIPRLAAKCDAEVVFAAADVSPFARRRDHAVATALKEDGRRLQVMPGAFVLDDLSAIRTGADKPYTVFTPFYRNWLAARRREPLGAPRKLPPLPGGVAARAIPSLGALVLPKLPDLDGDADLVWEPGERAARRLVSCFLHDHVKEYEDRHDAVAEHGTSRLSPYLHLGCVSPRELESQLGASDGQQSFRRQLGWRDFYSHVLLAHPQNAHVEHQERYRRTIKWRRAEKLFEAWQGGRTGYPLVDAAMRQLATTGWMHNRTRMVVGSFLVKDLGIDWRWGERWFMRLLLDGDEANNNGNWQWIASVGVDPQPVSRRIYNPTLQQRRFDPDGKYVRRYVPELVAVPDEYLAEPWTMPDAVQREVGCVIGTDYPAPVVDHATARREALERYSAAAHSAEASRP